MRSRVIGVSAVALLAVVIAGGVMAGEKKPSWKGSIKVEGKPSEAELQKLAKVAKGDAEKTALATVKAKDADKKVTESDLEVENGYLIYSFDITVKGKKGIAEVLVDAGTGKVLAQEHESAKSEKKEKEGGKKEKEGDKK